MVKGRGKEMEWEEENNIEMGREEFQKSFLYRFPYQGNGNEDLLPCQALSEAYKAPC